MFCFSGHHLMFSYLSSAQLEACHAFCCCCLAELLGRHWPPYLATLSVWCVLPHELVQHACESELSV